MRKFLLLLTGIVIGVAMLGVAIPSLIWLTSSNENVIAVFNDSKTVLHNASLAVTGMPDSRMDPVQPKGYFGQVLPAGHTEFRVAFDAADHHYEFSGEARAFPIGSSSLEICVDERMQFSFKVHGALWGLTKR